MFNSPWWTVGVGVNISTITDVEKVFEALVKKFGLLVKGCGDSMPVSI